MDDEEFKRRLSEVAEWTIPDTPRETSLNAKKKRGRKNAEELYQLAHEEVFLEEFGGVNPTYPPMLTRVKCQPVNCDDCGKTCEEGRKKEKKLYETNRTHWREKCITCNKFQNPFTGKFDLSPQSAAARWAEWLRQTNPRYVKKKDQESEGTIISNPENPHKI